MNKQDFFSDTEVNQTIKPEQLNQLIDAILAGKYSWACILILRFAGYNPLLYIPYRTYNRVLKENTQISSPNRHKTDSTNSAKECSVINFNGKSSGNYSS